MQLKEKPDEIIPEALNALNQYENQLQQQRELIKNQSEMMDELRKEYNKEKEEWK